MTKYYKSRHLDNPVVYVQEEGQWRGYAPGGVLQRSTGRMPEVILAQTVEISHEQAETLIRILRAETERIRKGQTDDAGGAAPPTPASSRRSGPGNGGALASDDESAGVHRFSSRRRSRRPSWLRYALMGGAAVIVLVVLAVLAASGVFGGGSGAPGPQAGTRPADVVAKVGGRSITREQLDQRVADFAAEYASQIPDMNTDPADYKVFQQDVLDYMVTYELASQKAQQLKIEVTEQDVQAQIDTILNVSFGGDQTKFDDALKQQGITLDQFKQSYKESMLLQKVHDEVTKDITTIPDIDIQAYYDVHKSDSYEGKSLDEVKDEIKSTLLSDKKSEAWLAWIEEQKQAVGVVYADGWETAATSTTLVP